MTRRCLAVFSLGALVGVLLTAAILSAFADPREPCDAERCASLCEAAAPDGSGPALQEGLDDVLESALEEEDGLTCEGENGYCPYTHSRQGSD